MKAKVHIRVAKTGKGRGYKVDASLKPNHAALTNGNGQAYPTAAFALDMDIPDVMFNRASQVLAEIEVPEGMAAIAAEVKLVEED